MIAERANPTAQRIGNTLTVCNASPTAPCHHVFMGQQSNKVIKRRRRIEYIERKKAARKEAMAAAKPKVRKPAAKKTPAATATSTAAVTEPTAE